MTRLERDSLTVVRTREGIAIINSSGWVSNHANRDDAYAEVLRLRSAHEEANIMTASTSEQLAFNIAERRIAELPDDLAALIRRDELRDQLDQHGLSAVQEWELRLLEEWPES